MEVFLRLGLSGRIMTQGKGSRVGVLLRKDCLFLKSGTWQKAHQPNVEACG